MPATLLHEYTLHNVSTPISKLEVKAGDKTDGIIDYKKRRIGVVN